MIDELEKECWGLDISFAKYILPRLLYLKNWVDCYSYPSEVEDSYIWNEILEELVWTFSYIERGYPSLATKYIKDVEFKDVESNNAPIDSFCSKTIEIIYTDKKLYTRALAQDDINVSRCKRGLKLFAEYYMNLWN